jgi:hypothetical protein
VRPTQRHGKVSWIKSAITPALKGKRFIYLTIDRLGGWGEWPQQAWL